jgi:hypothetical protein
MITGHMDDALTNPGQLSAVTFERAQEQANIGQQGASMAAGGELAGSGISSASPLYNAIQSSIGASAGIARGEAARDYSLAQEALKRDDIARETEKYLKILQTIFGLAGLQAQAAAGTGFSPAYAVNTNEGLSAHIASLGNYLQNYFDQKKKATPATPAAPRDTGPPT